MDSLALPSAPSNRVSLREELEALPTADLKAQLANTLGLTAGHLLRLAVIVSVLEDRGEDLSAMKGGLLTVLRKIACGELLPDLVVLFASEPAKIQQAARLPVAEQAEIVAGRKALPDRRRPRSSTRSSGPAGRPDRLTVAAGGLRLEADPASPADIGEVAGELVLACVDRVAALTRLIDVLGRQGVRLALAETAAPRRVPNPHPPGYWLNQTKSEG